MSSGQTKGLISLFDKELVSLDAVQHALLQCADALTEENIEPFLRNLVLSDSRPLLELILSGTFLGSTSFPFSSYFSFTRRFVQRDNIDVDRGSLPGS
jgi:hypothetical protein